MNASNTRESVTSPLEFLCPAPDALSITSVCGTPPICPNTVMSPSQMHSEFSAGSETAYRLFEWGNVTTRQWSSTHSPARRARARPKSICTEPGAHPSSTYPSPGSLFPCLHPRT